MFFSMTDAPQKKGGGRRNNDRGGRGDSKREKPEFDQQVIDMARVTRVTKGGKHMSFRAAVVIGDRKGRVGFGIDKGLDVQAAVAKAVHQAKKTMIRVPFKKGTIPHRVVAKYKAAEIMLKPAPVGSGLIAGGAVRTILELAGVPNASAKMLARTKNNTTNAKAVFKALGLFVPKARQSAKTVAVVTEEVAPVSEKPTRTSAPRAKESV